MRSLFRPIARYLRIALLILITACFYSIPVNTCIVSANDTGDLVKDAAKYLFHPDNKKGEEGYKGIEKYTLDQIHQPKTKKTKPKRPSSSKRRKTVEFIYANGNKVHLSNLTYGDKKYWPKEFSVFDSKKKKMVKVGFNRIAFIEYLDLAALNHPQYKYPSDEQRAKLYYRDGRNEIFHLDRNWYAWKGLNKQNQEKKIWQAGVKLVIFHPVPENMKNILKHLQNTSKYRSKPAKTKVQKSSKKIKKRGAGFGITIRDLGSDSTTDFGHDEDHGVLVVSVDSGSLAFGKLRADDLILEINLEKTTDVEQFKKILDRNVNNGMDIYMLVKSKRSVRVHVVNLGKLPMADFLSGRIDTNVVQKKARVTIICNDKRPNFSTGRKNDLPGYGNFWFHSKTVFMNKLSTEKYYYLPFEEKASYRQFTHHIEVEPGKYEVWFPNRSERGRVHVVLSADKENSIEYYLEQPQYPHIKKFLFKIVVNGETVLSKRAL